MSKAMLAKKILSKIENENDPMSHVIPKNKTAAPILELKEFDKSSELMEESEEVKPEEPKQLKPEEARALAS